MVEFRWMVVRGLLILTAVQAVLVAVLVGMAQLRKRREGPHGGFPWEEQPEVKVENGSSLELYPYGVRLYEAMHEAIENATECIHVGTFIWKDDETGRRFVDALAKKAREGVRVCVIFDGLANAFVSSKFKNFPDEIHTLHFRPIWGPRKLVNPRNLFRYHRHIMSVDGRVGFVGGYNIGSLYADSWRDTQIRIEGPDAREIENDLVDFWNDHRTPDLPVLQSVGDRSWDSTTVLHRNDPYMRMFPIRAMYLEAIDRANRHIYLTHAYFIPDRAMRTSLIDAVRRGVDVQVLVRRTPTT